MLRTARGLVTANAVGFSIQTATTLPSECDLPKEVQAFQPTSFQENLATNPESTASYDCQSVRIANPMPSHNLKPQKLKCPFCSTISTRGTGLSAHVRGQHAREYGKWNRNPNRLIEAAQAALPQQEPKRHRRSHRVPPSAPVESERAAAQQPRKLVAGAAEQNSENESREALSLLQKAHQQLSTRKQTIEGELARIEGLRTEHEAITPQVTALDEAINAFKHQH
jgi:hypothetical protein